MNNRLASLDSLRGLAALQVVFGHFLVAIPAYEWTVYQEDNTPHNFAFYLLHSPLHFFVSASPAVIVFFVLSGFVLSLPYFNTEKKATNYLSFFVKRILRLYVPCICAILLSIFLRQFFYNENYFRGYATWVNGIWSNKTFDWVKVFKLNIDEISYYIPSSWTLPIEIKLSLLLPFFALAIKKLNALLSILSVVIFLVLFTLIGKTALKDLIPDYGLGYYMTFFLTGSVLCKYRIEVLHFINKQKAIIFGLFLFVVLNIYTIDYNNWIFPSSILIIETKLEHYILGFAALAFIVYALSARLSSLMNSRLLVFFGRISFSIYLLHQLVFVLLISVLHNYLLPNMWLLFIAFPTSVLFAVMFYNYVEKPSITLSHWVSTKMKSAINYKTSFR